jgi:hypothetical protein
MKKFSWSNRDFHETDDYDDFGIEESVVNIITSNNFVIDEEEKQGLEARFRLVQDKLPSASCINLKLRNCEGTLRADLVVNSPNVRFRVNCDSDNNTDLFNNIFELLKKEIRLWRQYRFQDRADVEENYEDLYASL